MVLGVSQTHGIQMVFKWSSFFLYGRSMVAGRSQLNTKLTRGGETTIPQLIQQSIREVPTTTWEASEINCVKNIVWLWTAGWVLSVMSQPCLQNGIRCSADAASTSCLQGAEPLEENMPKMQFLWS